MNYKYENILIKPELWNYFDLANQKSKRYSSKILISLFLNEFLLSNFETKIDDACVNTFKYMKAKTSFKKSRNLEMNLIIGSLIIQSKPFVHNSIAGWVFLDTIHTIISNINKNRHDKEDYFMTEYILGELNLILGNASASSKHFININKDNSDAFILSKIASSLQMKGNIREAKTFHKKMMEVSNQLDLDDNTFVHLSWLETWDEKEIKYVDYVSKLDFKNIKLNTFEPSIKTNIKGKLVGKIIRKANISDHNFLIKLNFEWNDKLNIEHKILEFENQYSLQINMFSEGKVNFKIGNGKKWLADIVHSKKILKGNNSVLLIKNEDNVTFQVNGIDEKAPKIANFIIPSTYVKVKSLNNVVNVLNLKIDIEKYSSSKINKKYENITIYTSFYGQEFLELLHVSLFPTLFAKDNLLKYPSNKIFWKIYTTKEQVSKLKTLQNKCSKLGIKMEIDCSIMGLESDSPRDALGETVKDCISFSIKNSSLMVIAPPDHVFGHGLLKVLEKMKPFDYVVTSHPFSYSILG